MFVHVGFKPLWPVIFFLPWLLLGIAFLIESVLHRTETPRPARARAPSLHDPPVTHDQ
jgi:hypothetical protein